MKNLLLIIAIAITTSTIAQTEQGIGVKGGLNYNGNGDYFESITENYSNPDRSLGYHVGIFGKIGDKLYFRPEIVYTQTKSKYDDDTFSMQKLDAPLLVGLKVLGPVSIFGGPSLQYILDTDFDSITIGDVKEDFSVGLNFGIGLNFKKLGIDIRYERGFSENEATLLNNNIQLGNKIDTRPDQLILSLSLLL